MASILRKNHSARLAELDESLLDLMDLLRAIQVQHPVAKTALRKALNALLQASISLHGATLAEASLDDDDDSAASA